MVPEQRPGSMEDDIEDLPTLQHCRNAVYEESVWTDDDEAMAHLKVIFKNCDLARISIISRRLQFYGKYIPIK